MNSTDQMPFLRPDCRLYFDGKHDRWVLKAPQQMVFPDRLTLIVLQACDGSCTPAQIVSFLKGSEHLDTVSEADVLELLDEYQRRGFLAVQPIQ